MNTVQIAPDGVPAEFAFEIPAPADLSSLGGVRLYFTFDLAKPSPFEPHLYLDDVQYPLMVSASGPLSMTFACQLPGAVATPAQARLVVNESGHLDPGNTVTAYAWGAQTHSGTGALNPDEGGEPSVMTDTIEVGQVQVLSWLEWKRLTGENQGQPIGS
jgi:hypothetical protein